MTKLEISILLILVFLTPFELLSQTSEETKIRSLVNTSYNFYDMGELDSALRYSNSALVMAKLLNNPLLEVRVLINKGIIYRGYNEPDLSRSAYKKALILAEQANSLKQISIISNNLGNLYLDYYKNDSALYYFFKSVEYKEQHGSPYRLLKTYCNISNAFRLNYQLHEALEYAGKALKIIESNHEISSYGKALTYFQLGNAYYELDSLELAIENYNYCKQLSQEISHKKMLSTCELNLGNIAFIRNDFPSALNLYRKCLPVITESGDDEQIIRVYNNIGNVWNKMEKPDSALFYYRNAEQLARKYKETSRQLGPILESLSSVYLKMGAKDSALIYMKERVQVAQNFYKESTANAIAELETQYETEKKEKEIIAQRERIQQAVIQRKNLFSALITVIFIAASGILFFIFRSRTLKLQNERNIEKHNKEVNSLLQEQEIKSLDAMLEGQDRERKRIAEDLHDRLGTTLAATKMHLEAAEKHLQPKQYAYIDNLLNTAIEDTRNISHNMLSGILTKFGLIAAFSDLKETIEATGSLSVTIKTIQFDERLTTEKELNLYRIAQELISNALKHSKATQLSITLEKKKKLLCLLVSDNGIGFNNDKIHNGIGLINVQSRVSKIEGTLSIKSTLGKGTITEIKVPL